MVGSVPKGRQGNKSVVLPGGGPGPSSVWTCVDTGPWSSVSFLCNTSGGWSLVTAKFTCHQD